MKSKVTIMLEVNKSPDFYKMVLLVRTDLKMGKGKIAAQCCHAAIGAYKLAILNVPNSIKIWEQSGTTKIALTVPDLETFFNLEKLAKESGLITYSVIDAGRTQIAAGSHTVLAIGPGPASLIDTITGHLKLL